MLICHLHAQEQNDHLGAECTVPASEELEYLIQRLTSRQTGDSAFTASHTFHNGESRLTPVVQVVILIKIKYIARQVCFWARESRTWFTDLSWLLICEVETHLLHEHINILLRRAEAGLVVHGALHKLALHVQILKLSLKLLHSGGHLLQVVGCQRLRTTQCCIQDCVQEEYAFSA